MSAGAISSSLTGAVGQTTNAFADLSSEDFIKVLLTELTNQDPFEPQDASVLLEQFSSLRNIESQLTLQQKLETLVLQNQVSAGSGLIGKVATGLDTSNNQIEGLVTSIRVQDDKVILELDTGHALPMDRVTEISELTG